MKTNIHMEIWLVWLMQQRKAKGKVNLLTTGKNIRLGTPLK